MRAACPGILLFRALEARRRRELQPALDMLHACDAEAAGDGTPQAIRDRLHRIQALVEDIAGDPFYAFLERTWMLQQVPVGAALYLIGGGP